MRAKQFIRNINEGMGDGADADAVVAEVIKLIGEGHTEVSPDVITTKVSAALGRPFMLKDLVACNNSSPELQHYIDSINPTKIKFSTDILTVKNEDPMKAKQQSQSGVANMAARAAGRARLGEDLAEETGDKPFDVMMKRVTKPATQAQRRQHDREENDRRREQRKDIGFGASPADQLSIRRKGVAEGGFFDPDQPNIGDMVQHKYNKAIGKVTAVGTQGNHTQVYFKDKSSDLYFGEWKKHVFPVKQPGVAEGWESGPDERSSRSEQDPDAGYDDQRQSQADAEQRASQARRPQEKYYTLTGRGPNMEPNYAFPGEYASQEDAIAARTKLMADPKTPNPRDIGISVRTRYLGEAGDTPLRDREDYTAKKKALQDLQMDPHTSKDAELSTEVMRRLAGLEKQKSELK